MDSARKPASEAFLIRAFKIGSQVFADFVLGGLGYFNNTGVPPLAVLGLILGFVRLNKKLRKSKIVFIMYWIGIVMSMDFVVALIYAANASYGKSIVIILGIIYVVLLAVKKAFKWPDFMTAVQLLIVPVILLGFVIKSGEIWNPANRCNMIDSVPGVRIINSGEYNFNKIPHTAIPRFFIPRPSRGDILVCDHIYVYEKNIQVKQAINRLDTRTGMMTVWLDRGNVLAIREEPKTGIIYAIVQKNYRSRTAPNVQLITFSPEGKILRRKDFGLNRNTFYGASITILPDKLYITIESNFYAYHRKDGRIEKFNISGNTGTPVYRTAWVKPYLYGTSSVSPLIGRLFGSRHLLKFNLETRNLEGWISDYPVGIFDIEKRPGRAQLAASRNFPSGGWLLDYNLKKIKKLVIPPGVREIEFSKNGKYLFATGFFTGKFYVIDPDANKLIAEVFTGYGSRGMAVSDDGYVIIGANCGVVGVDVDKFLRGRKAKK